MERFYYRSKDNTGFLNLKSPKIDENYIQITKEEFEELTKPKVYVSTAEEKAAQEKAQKIVEYKKYLADTDYIVLKIAEARSEGGDITALRTEYAEQLAKRKEARNKINKLEVK